MSFNPNYPGGVSSNAGLPQWQGNFQVAGQVPGFPEGQQNPYAGQQQVYQGQGQQGYFDAGAAPYAYPNLFPQGQAPGMPGFPDPAAYGAFGLDSAAVGAFGGMGGPVGPSAPKAPPQPPPANFPGPFQLFVGDLGREVTEPVLHAAFAQRALAPKAVKVMVDPSTGRSKGFGFVVFDSRPDAERALVETQQALVGSRRIRVNWGSNHSKWGAGAGPGQGGAGQGGPGGFGLPPNAAIPGANLIAAAGMYQQGHGQAPFLPGGAPPPQGNPNLFGGMGGGYPGGPQDPAAGGFPPGAANFQRRF